MWLGRQAQPVRLPGGGAASVQSASLPGHADEVNAIYGTVQVAAMRRVVPGPGRRQRRPTSAEEAAQVLELLARDVRGCGTCDRESLGQKVLREAQRVRRFLRGGA